MMMRSAVPCVTTPLSDLTVADSEAGEKTRQRPVVEAIDIVRVSKSIQIPQSGAFHPARCGLRASRCARKPE